MNRRKAKKIVKRQGDRWITTHLGRIGNRVYHLGLSVEYPARWKRNRAILRMFRDCFGHLFRGYGEYKCQE